jgi:hypothetical protein
MSDQYIGKKMVEEEDLKRFLEAYEEVTGEALKIIDGGERPDFIAVRTTGEQVGIELTRTPHDYEMAQWDRIFGTIHPMNDFDVLDTVHCIVDQKAKKRAEGNWRLPSNTILVIKLIDYTFMFPGWFEKKCLADDYADAGFSEVWLADHTQLDAYGAVRLIGLYPRRIWGLHHQPSFLQKPYG